MSRELRTWISTIHNRPTQRALRNIALSHDWEPKKRLPTAFILDLHRTITGHEYCLCSSCSRINRVSHKNKELCRLCAKGNYCDQSGEIRKLRMHLKKVYNNAVSSIKRPTNTAEHIDYYTQLQHAALEAGREITARSYRGDILPLPKAWLTLVDISTRVELHAAELRVDWGRAHKFLD